MIPKKIHYCWFGRGKKPPLVDKCIKSWKKYCPDYEIIEWNEDNLDVNMNQYTKYHYDKKNYAFLCDYVRLEIVYKYGGFYFDTDVELVKNIDFLLNYSAVFGFESKKYVNTGQGFGAEANHITIYEMKSVYEKFFPNEDGEFKTVSCPIYNTESLKKFGIKLDGKTQNIDNMIIFSPEYMNPYDDLKGVLNKTNNTISIHWYMKSWISRRHLIRSKITRPFHRVFGDDCFKWLKRKG